MGSRSANQKAWQELMQQSGGKLTHNPFEDVQGNFAFADYAGITTLLCPNKSRRLGQTGFVDTVESVFEMDWEME